MRIVSSGLALLIVLLVGPAYSSEPLALPPPDGPFRVGTTVWHMIDSSREDRLTEAKWDRRELMVQAWYPTCDDSSKRAPYASDMSMVTNAMPGASVAKSNGQLPIIMIAPGRGVPGSSYTAVAESLASDGFMVVAVDSPHSGRVAYPDGRVVPPSSLYRMPPGLISGPYEKVDAFFEPAAVQGGLDLIFVLNELAKLNAADPAGRLTAKLDLTRVGIFGHSLGGRIAGAAVAKDGRFVAIMFVEGIAPRQERRDGLNAAVAMLLSAGTYPYAINNVRELVPNRRNDVFIMKIDEFEHNSVTDRLFLGNDPENSINALDNIALTREIAFTFFDRYLRAASLDIDASGIWPSRVSIESHPRFSDSAVK